MSKISEDLLEMNKKLGEYIDRGRAIGFHETRKEPVIAVTPDKSKIKPLRKMENCDVHFIAVDCSTRTLKRANNWGVYLFRTAYASVKKRDVHWDYEERIHTVVGDAYVRRRILQDVRLNLESEMALGLARDAGESDYLLLDGASYFGGERKFWVEL
ncbi:MAG: DNA double-strand break repair nuclease NurA, partial [Candidatus Bathyarchaeota archaeon]